VAAAQAVGRRLVLLAGCRLVPDDLTLAVASTLHSVVLAFVPWMPGLGVDDHFRHDCGATARPAGQTAQEIHDGEVITLGQYSWTAVATPGHDAHLLCYWKRRTAMFAYSDLLSTRGTAIPWYAPGGGGTSACLESLRRAVHGGAVLSISGQGCLLEGADAVAASAATTARQVTARAERMTAMLTRGPVTFSDLEQCVCPQKCTT